MPTVKPRIGRPSIFGRKDQQGSRRYQGVVGLTATRALEDARVELGAVYLRIMGRPFNGRISDADLFEFLAIGPARTETWLRQQRRREK